MRIPAALSVLPRGAPELLPTGIAEVDTMLGGGLPLGGVTEIIGPVCSGRSTLVLSVLAGITGQGQGSAGQGAAAAYVDVSDALDPLSAAAMGVDLGRLLWVRAGGSELMEPMTQKKNTATERSPDPRLRPFHKSRRHSAAKEVWDRLDQGLRATDLLLNTGGFRAIVIDMGDVGPEQARRVPLASWYRFRLQAEKSQAILLLVTQAACASSCASVVLRCTEADERWQYANESPAGLPLLTGFRYQVSADRKRGSAQQSFHPCKKKPVSVAETSWTSTTNGTTLWAQ
jgi:hypothetical protein